MDLKFLETTLAEPLSSALAQLIIDRPIDPIQYLSDYLMHHSREQGIQRLEATDKARMAEALAEFQKKKAEEEERAAIEIQAVLRAEQEKIRKRKEEESGMMDALDKSLSAEDAEADPLGVIRKAASPTVMRDVETFVFDSAPGNKKKAAALVRGVRHLLGERPLKPKAPLKPLVPAQLVQALQTLDPAAKHTERKFANVRRILSYVALDDARGLSYALFVLCRWLTTVVDLRRRAVNANKTAMEADKSVESVVQEEEEGAAAEPEEEGDDPDAVAAQ